VPRSLAKVELAELLAVLALLDQPLAGRFGDLGEAAETVLHVAQPVAAFGVFALVDDVDAGRALPRNDSGHVRGKVRRIARGETGIGSGSGERQAADMGGENLCIAAFHRTGLCYPK
jgi:hypothetical protein